MSKPFDLSCDGWCDRKHTSTHIDHKGYGYCEPCGNIRRQSGYRATTDKGRDRVAAHRDASQGVLMSKPKRKRVRRVVRQFIDLPLGTRFSYIEHQRLGQSPIWVILDRTGFGLIAEWDDSKVHSGGWVGQRICSVADSESQVKKLLVLVVE